MELEKYLAKQTQYQECAHAVQEIRKFPNCNQFKYQCLQCGQRGQAIPHDELSGRDLENMPLVDKSLAKNYYESQRKQNQEIYQQGKQIERNKFFKIYGDYLRSHDWKARRTAVLRRDGYMCQSCLINPAREVHHLSYKHWGNEPLFELVSVCKPCHEKITEMDRSGNPGYTAELDF